MNYSSLQEALDAADDGATVTLYSDVVLEEGEEVVITKSMTLSGEYTISSSADQSPIKIEGNDNNVEVTLEDVTFSSEYSTNNTTIYDTGRAVTVDLAGGDVVLNLKGVTLVADGGTTGGYGSAVMVESASSTTHKATITIDDCTLLAPNGHALRVYAPADIVVTNSTLSGWSIAYFQAHGGNSAGSTLSIADSTMVSTGRTGTSNDFGAFVVCTAIDNVKVEGGTLDVISNTNTQSLLMLDYNPGGTVTFENIAITASGDDFVVESVCDSCVSDASVVDLNLGAGVTTNFEIPADFVADGCSVSEADGEYTVSQS